MRILAAAPGPNFSVQDVHVGWVEALRELGQTVVEFNLSERLTFYDAALLEVGRAADGSAAVRKALSAQQAQELAVNGLYAALYKVRPHLLLVTSAFFVPPELLDLARASRTKVVLLHTEEPYEHARQLALAEHADLNLINDPTNLAAFQALGPAEYIPHAYRPAIHHPGMPHPALAADLAFVGTGYASRVAFFEAMANGGRLDDLDILLAGNWQQLDESSPLRAYVAHDDADCLDNTQAAAIYRSMRVGLNLYRREAETPELAAGYAMGPREVEMASCGAFFLRDPRPEGDEALGMLPTFTGPDDASEQLRWWLTHPTERQSAADQARAAIAGRTFTAHATALLRHLDREPVTT